MWQRGLGRFWTLAPPRSIPGRFPCCHWKFPHYLLNNWQLLQLLVWREAERGHPWWRHILYTCAHGFIVQKLLERWEGERGLSWWRHILYRVSQKTWAGYTFSEYMEDFETKIKNNCFFVYGFFQLLFAIFVIFYNNISVLFFQYIFMKVNKNICLTKTQQRINIHRCNCFIFNMLIFKVEDHIRLLLRFKSRICPEPFCLALSFKTLRYSP